MSNFDYKKAQKRVKKKKEFYQHLSTSVVVIIVCFVINQMTSPWYSWYKWVVLGMGFSVIMHYITVFGVPGLFKMDADWEEREIEKELQKRGKSRKTIEAPRREEGLELKDIEPEKRKNYDDSDFV